MTIWKVSASSSSAQIRPALFLDRDGVVIADEHYLADPAKVRLIPQVAAAMKQARAAGFLLVGVSNQSGIGRGYFSEADFNKVMLRLEELLAQEEVGFDSFHYCPHAPGDDCLCRKPRSGMLDEARTAHGIDLQRSWMIGDKGSDVAFGREHGMSSVLVRTGYGQSEEAAVRTRWSGDDRVLVAEDLPAAVDLILSGSHDSAGDES